MHLLFTVTTPSSLTASTVKVFDILFVKTAKSTKSLLAAPLWKRKALLDTLLTSEEGVMEVVEVQRVSTAQHIIDFLMKLVEER